MKTIFLILTIFFGLYGAAFVIVYGIRPAILGTLESYSIFQVSLSIPFFLIAVFFRWRGSKRDWNDDFFYLLFKLFSKKGNQVKNSMKDQVNKTKNRIRDEIN